MSEEKPPDAQETPDAGEVEETEAGTAPSADANADDAAESAREEDEDAPGDEEADDEDEGEEQPQPEREPRERPGPAVVAGWALVALLALNLTGVVVGLPSIQADVDASFRDLVWVQVAFLGGLAVLLPLVPVVAGALGRRPTIVLGAVLLAAGSGLALVATTPEPLIAGRALQGAGAALLLVLLAAPGPSMAVALAFGPLAAGLLVKALDWQWLFWVQFALIFAALILGLRAKAEEARTVALDPIGTAAYALGLPALLLALVQLDDWSWQVVLGLGVGGLLALSSLVPLDRRTDSPVLDFRPFRDLTFLSTAIATAVLAGAFWAALLFAAQNLQDVFGHNPLETGAILLPLTLPLVVAGSLRGRFDARTLMIAALVLGIGGLVILGLVGKADDDVRVVPGLLLLGLALLGAAAALPALATARLPVVVTPQAAAVARRRTGAASRRPHSSHATGGSTAEREKPRRGATKPKRGAAKKGDAKRHRVGAAEAAAAKKRREEREKAARKKPEPAAETPREEKRGRRTKAEDAAEPREEKRKPEPALEARPEAGALEWSRLAGGVVVLAAISSLFLSLFADRKAEVTPSASEGGPGPNTLLDGLLSGSPDVAQRLSEFSAAVRLGVELALRDALSYASGRALFLGAALLLAAVLFMWRAGPPPSSPDPDQDDPRHSRFPL
jgi:MFS family permease